MPDLTQEAIRKEATERLEHDIKASSTHESDDSRLRNMAAWLESWGIQMFPPTLASVKAVAASLKAGGYRSAHIYLSVYRVEAQRRGYAVDMLLGRHLQDYKRSCLRGLGGPVRPRALPLHEMGKLSPSREPWVIEGPINPKAAILCGPWWMCREVELASARARLVELRVSSCPPVAIWHLPTSKNDPEAIGATRSLSCLCKEFGCRANCPVHILWDHLAFLRVQFPASWCTDGPSWDLPLFPSSTGTVVTKQAMAKTIEAAATQLDIPLAAPDGCERVSGHSLRVSGAQGLARLGWDLWAIQLHGRWHSDVVKHYVRDAHLSPVGVAAHSGSGLTLELIVEATLKKLRSSSRVGAEVIPKLDRPAAPDPEAVASMLAEQPARSAEPELSPELLVLHAGSGIYHRIVEQGLSRTACGWDFAASTLAVRVPDHAAGPHGWFQLCGRCWPWAREVAKDHPVPRALASPK